MKLTLEQLKNNIERRTEPFYFDHAVLSPVPAHVNTPDAYGRNLEKVYDKVVVYTSPSTSPYYIWTQLGNGRALVDRLTRNYQGRWVTARLKFSGGTTYRISSVGFQIASKPKEEEPKTMFPNVEKPKNTKKDEFVQMELFENGKITYSQLKSLLFEGISSMARASFERDLAKVQRAVDRFNSVRRQAAERMGTEDSLYLETGSTFESPPSYISEMEIEVTDKQVRVNWNKQEEKNWKLVTTADSEFDWRDKNGEFDADRLVDTVNYMTRGIKRAVKYWEKVNPDNEEQVRTELERDED